MLRALFLEFPDDPGSWLVDDEYLYGDSLLVAPLLHSHQTARAVYLPPGTWIDYQTGQSYSGGWNQIAAGPIPEIILVRDGTVIPRIALAQSTAQLDWSTLELAVFAKTAATAAGAVFLPGDAAIHRLALTQDHGTFQLVQDPLPGRVNWQIRAGAP